MNWRLLYLIVVLIALFFTIGAYIKVPDEQIHSVNAVLWGLILLRLTGGDTK